MSKVLSVLARASTVGLLLFLACGAGSGRDTAQRLLSDAQDKVVKLTPVDNPRTGGTGFLVVAPNSGITYILTNAHICEVSTNGYLMATKDSWKKGIAVRILEKADYTDLCLLEALPGATGGYTLAEDVSARERLFAVGHPHLKPLTITDGFIVERLDIELVEAEKNREQCVGPGYVFKDVDTMFGPLPLCVKQIDGWDTSIEIYPGNSGSPQLNARGELTGVMFAADGRTHRGSSIPLDVVRGFLGFF
jgi:S1-C subfamily serine protease